MREWSDFFFRVATITENEISGDSASFEFVFSDSNQTLEVSDFLLLESKAGEDPGPLDFNGTVRKQ
jgi:hypothetical protein